MPPACLASPAPSPPARPEGSLPMRGLSPGPGCMEGGPTRLDRADVSPASLLGTVTPREEPGEERGRLGAQTPQGRWRAVALSRDWVWAAYGWGGLWRQPTLTPRKGWTGRWWEPISGYAGWVMCRSPTHSRKRGKAGAEPLGTVTPHQGWESGEVACLSPGGTGLRSLGRAPGWQPVFAAKSTPSPPDPHPAPTHPRPGASLPG